MSTFQFKHFSIRQTHAAMKVGTDAMVLGALCHFPQAPVTVLDIGAGTGVLSLMLAQRFQPETVVAVELDNAACSDAQFNFDQAPFQTAFELHPVSITDFSASTRFDAIVSNPPFFDNSSKGTHAERNQARHTDTLTSEQLLAAVAHHLAAEGRFWVILPAEKSVAFTAIAAEKKLFLQEEIRIAGKPGKPVRSILGYSFSTVPEVTQRLFTIRTESGNYTREYIDATIDFHGVAL